MENSSLWKLIGLLLLALLGYTVYRTEMAHREIAALKDQIETLQGGETEAQPEAPKEEAVKEAPVKRFLFSKAKDRVSRVVPKEIEVTARLKLDNRYAAYGLKLPRIVGDAPGTVVVKITATQVGDIVAASIDSGTTTISDPDILDACKEAALRTDISSNWEAPKKQVGSITYSFE